jgi:hypothetical protein
MRDQTPETGRIATLPGRALSRKASLKRLLERIDQMRRDDWENLLRLQQEQLDLLTSLIEAKIQPPGGAGPDLSAQAQHRNARERTSTIGVPSH